MKKILFYVLCVCLFGASPTFAAQAAKVSALTPFDSTKPVTKMKVIVLEKVTFKNGLVFEDGTVVVGDIIDVKQPHRGKLNASFKFKPEIYTYNGKTTKIEDAEFVAKYAEYKELDKLGLATSAATTVGSTLLKVPFLSQGVSLVKGFYNNSEGNRLKSAGLQVYKDSPLAYIEEGKDIVINKDTMFLLKFKSSATEDLDAPPPNNVTPANETAKQATPEQVENSDIIPVSTTPIQPEAQTVVKTQFIPTVHPEDVLLEVENAKK